LATNLACSLSLLIAIPVLLKMSMANELCVAKFTFKGAIGMRFTMMIKTGRCVKFLRTQFAFVCGIKMSCPMLTKVRRCVKFLWTQIASEGRIEISFPMLTKVVWMSESFRATIAFVGLCTCVRNQMVP
jgi:hypothetical protein